MVNSGRRPEEKLNSSPPVIYMYDRRMYSIKSFHVLLNLHIFMMYGDMTFMVYMTARRVVIL